MNAAQYTEHYKLLARVDEHAHVTAFIEWLQNHGSAGIAVRDSTHDKSWASDEQLARLVADYFGVDFDKFIAEDEAMHAREAQANVQ